MHRLYENNEIVIFWNSDKCFHSTKCIQASPLTFDVNRKPWIQLGNASNPEVWKAVEQCPSGALGILYRHGIDVMYDPELHIPLERNSQSAIAVRLSAPNGKFCNY